MAKANRATKNFSAAARAEMSRTGRENMPHAKEVRQQRLESTREASLRFQAGLAEEVGKASASREALIVSAAGSFTGLFAVLERLRSARDTAAIAALTDLLRPLQSGLLRSLTALGVAKGTDGDDAEDTGPTLDEYCRTLAERKRSEQAANAGGGGGDDERDA